MKSVVVNEIIGVNTDCGLRAWCTFPRMCDSLIFDPTSISSPEPPLFLSNGWGNWRSERIQSQNHKIVVPVWLRLREIVNPFDQEKFSREIFLAHTLLQFSLSTAEICMWWTRFYRAIGDGFFRILLEVSDPIAVQKDRGLGERHLSNVTSFKVGFDAKQKHP